MIPIGIYEVAANPTANSEDTSLQLIKVFEQTTFLAAISLNTLLSDVNYNY